MTLSPAATPSAIRLCILGGAALVRADGSEVRNLLAQPKRFALLVHLALAGSGAFHRRDALLALLWPESTEERARGALRTALHFLRAHVGDGVVVSRGADEIGIAEGALVCDARLVEAHLDAGRLEAALAAYAGPLLPAFGVGDAPAFDDWLDGERRRLARRVAGAAWRLADGAEQAGDAAAAVGWGRQAAAHEEHDEMAVRRLMLLLGRTGDRAAALRVYDDLARRLEREHAAVPSPETAAVAAELRRPVVPVVPIVPIVPIVPPTPVAHAARSVPEPRRAEPAPALRLVPDAAPAAAPPPGGAEAPPHVSGERRVRRDLLPAPPRRWPLPVRIALAAVAALAAVGIALANGPARAGARDEGGEVAGTRVAVLPFAVRGEQRLAYLGEGMVDLMSATLDGAGELNATDPRAVLASAGRGAVAGPDDGARVAAAVGARYYVLGGVVATGDALRVTASLYDRAAGGEPVAVASADGRADALFRIVDALTADLLARRARGPGARFERIAARTTGSLPALKSYLQGTQALRRGEFEPAAELFAQALAVDSTFALAAYERSVALDEAGLAPPPGEPTPLERAARHAGRLADRVQRLVAARGAVMTARTIADRRRAEQLYRDLLATYPDDVEGWYQLGDLVYHFRPTIGGAFPDARPMMERVLALDPGHASASQHLARIAAAEDDRAAVDSLTRRLIAGHPGGDIALEMLALRALALADAAALAALPAALAAVGDNRARVTVWRAMQYSGNLAGGWALLAPLGDASRPHAVRVQAAVERAHLALARGRPRDAAAALAEAERLQPGSALGARRGWGAYPFLDGRCRAESGPLVAATDTVLAAHVLAAACASDQAAVARLAAPRHPGDTGAARLRAVGLAHLAWVAAPPPAAIDSLLRDPAWGPDAHAGPRERFVRAELLRLAGRREEALDWYAAVPEDLLVASLVYEAPARLRQAELLDAEGRHAEADRHWRRLARLWTDAEPSLQPIVARASARAGR